MNEETNSSRAIDTTKLPKRFKEPSDTITYDNYRWVGSHNAHTYMPFFIAVTQQDADITTQLDFGIRGLMFDTYDWNIGFPYSRKGSGNVVLSHGIPGEALTNLQKANPKYQTLKYELAKVIDWLKRNPKAIVTIILEDYANAQTTAKEIKEAAAEAKYDPIFKPSELGGKWPTLGWMRSTNNRLIIFTQRAGNTDVTFSQFSYCFENTYSNTSREELWKERVESKRGPSNRKIVIFNNFPIDPITSYFNDQILYDVAKDVTGYAKEKKFAGGRVFNGYFVDHVISNVNQETGKKKTVFDYVNELNI